MNWRRSIGNLAGEVSRASLVWPLAERVLKRSANILYYHHPGEKTDVYSAFDAGYTLQHLRQDLGRIKRQFQVLPLTELLQTWREETVVSKPQLAITFDDGFDLKRQGVQDILEEHGIKATTFVVTSCLDNQRLMWRHKLSVIQALTPSDILLGKFNHLTRRTGHQPAGSSGEIMQAAMQWEMSQKEEWVDELWQSCGLLPEKEYLGQVQPYFSWQGLREWGSKGHEVGFHTHTHPDCSRLDAEAIESELVQPAEKLKSSLGLPSMAFSYPFGRRLKSQQESTLMTKQGFCCMLGTDGFSQRGTPPMRLGRENAEAFGMGWALFVRPLCQSFGLNRL